MAVLKDTAIDKVGMTILRLDELGVPVGATVGDAAKALRTAGHSAGQNVVSEAQKQRRKISSDDLEEA
jgi:hypothetical protein